MNEALVKLQKSIYETLANDSGLANMVTGIYDFVPEDTSYPFVAIQQHKIQDWSTISKIGYEVDMMISCYSNQHGSKEIIEIFTYIYDLLHDSVIALEGSNILVSIKNQDNNVKRSSDGSVFISDSIFKALVELV